MQPLGLTQTKLSLSPQRSRRVRKDLQLIDDALEDDRRTVLAQTALHLAAQIVERAQRHQ